MIKARERGIAKSGNLWLRQSARKGYRIVAAGVSEGRFDCREMIYTAVQQETKKYKEIEKRKNAYKIVNEIKERGQIAVRNATSRQPSAAELFIAVQQRLFAARD